MQPVSAWYEARSAFRGPRAAIARRRSTYALARWWFLRLLGVVYLVAFWSLATQILGLVGHNGILPAGVGDTWLRGVCVGGVALAMLLIAGVAPAALLPLLWAAYLSLSMWCGPFLSFQWDALLLETGLLAIFIAPDTWRDRLRTAADPPRLAVWLMWWLLFRLMVGSGAVKLASGDPTWRDLTALTFHFETQPIPTPVAWYAHHFPAWFNKGSTVVVLAIELFAPFSIIGPRRLRAIAFGLLVGLQSLIVLTGNYAFFNLLSAALCLFLLDDEAFGRTGARAETTVSGARGFPPSRKLRRTAAALAEAGQPSVTARLKGSPSMNLIRRLRHAALIAVAVVTVPVSALAFTSGVGFELPFWPLVAPVADLIAPLRSVNRYGLFAVMTTTRPEIIVEGSDDGEQWLSYEFTYKAGDVRRRPPWVAPHQPRLDWQMWFAALGRYDDDPWVQSLFARLLEGSPEVLRLLERDPFRGRPPRYVRGVLYRYRFSDAAARRRDGAWWTRERLGVFSPVMSLRKVSSKAPSNDCQTHSMTEQGGGAPDGSTAAGHPDT